MGYEIIHSSDKCKIEISTNRTVLRKTVFKKGVPHEFLYYREINPAIIKEIEELSENWQLLSKDNLNGYYVEIQRNASNDTTGNIRIIPEGKAKHMWLLGLRDFDRDDFIYYVRRRRR